MIRRRPGPPVRAAEHAGHPGTLRLPDRQHLPFLGPTPGPLLATCDEFVLVMRAEPTASRTLPAFLELVQRARGQGPSLTLRGILLTLPGGENSGGRWERELRGHFGSRIL